MVTDINHECKQTDKQKLMDLQSEFLDKYCEFSKGEYCSKSMINMAFMSYLRILDRPDIRKIFDYSNYYVIDFRNDKYVKTFKLNHFSDSLEVYVNIRLKSFPMKNNDI